MDKEILVNSDIQAGKKLVEMLDRSKFLLEGALWFYFSETAEWRLLLVSKLVDTIGPKRAYNIVWDALNELRPEIGFSLERVSVLSPKNKIIQLLRKAIRAPKGISEIRFSKNTISGIFIEDAFIYRLT